jgi:hypothetical protein
MLQALRLPCVTILAVLLFALPLHARASAPEPAAARGTAGVLAPTLTPGKDEHRLTVVRELVVGLSFNILAVAGAVGTGLAAGALASSPDAHGDAVFLDDHGERVFAGVTVSSVLLAAAPATALGVHLGDRQRGSYKLSLLGSFVGGAGLGGLTFAIAWPALSAHHAHGESTAALIATGVSTLGFMGGALWGEHRSRADARGPHAQVFPVLAAQHGLSLGVAGRF